MYKLNSYLKTVCSSVISNAIDPSIYSNERGLRLTYCQKGDGKPITFLVYDCETGSKLDNFSSFGNFVSVYYQALSQRELEEKIKLTFKSNVLAASVNVSKSVDDKLKNKYPWC